MVVVARHDDHLLVGTERGAQLGQNRLGDVKYAGDRPGPELERVAEQDQTVDVGQSLREYGPGGVVLEHRHPRACPEVQIRDDQGAQVGA